MEKTHDLVRLHDRMVEWKSELEPLAAHACLELAQAYFTDRYPGFDQEDPDWPKLRGQLQRVEELMAAVKARLGA